MLQANMWCRGSPSEGAFLGVHGLCALSFRTGGNTTTQASPPYETSFDMGNNSEKGETQEPASINGIGPVCACRASFVLMEPGAVGRGPEALLQIAELLQAYSFAEN